MKSFIIISFSVCAVYIQTLLARRRVLEQKNVSYHNYTFQSE